MVRKVDDGRAYDEQALLAPYTADQRKALFALRDAARRGHYVAYRKLNGFLPDASDHHDPKGRLRYDAIDKDTVRKLLSDMLCKNCGKFHGGWNFELVQVPAADGRMNEDGTPGTEGRIRPITCPHCGTEDCAGPFHHVHIEMKEIGKTVEVFGVYLPFMAGWIAAHGIIPRLIVVGANNKESHNRRDMLRVALERPWHEFVWGHQTVPKKRNREDGIDCEGWGRAAHAIVGFHGIEAVPNGHHGHVAVGDDFSNANNELLNPSDGAGVRIKFYGTFMQGCLPYSRTVVLGNICSPTGLNAEIREKAREYPDRYTLQEVFCDKEPTAEDFQSPCPERLPKSYLLARFLDDDLEFRRSFMGVPMTPDQLSYKSYRIWTPKHRTARWTQHFRERFEREGNLIVDADLTRLNLVPWQKMFGLDPAFTGDSVGVKGKHGRSMTGACCMSHHPSGHNLLLYAETKYLAAGEHEDYTKGKCLELACKDVNVETTAAQATLVRPLQQAGLNVFTYNPSDRQFGGSKENRKLPLAAAVNRGEVLFPGYVDEMWLRSGAPDAKPIMLHVYAGLAELKKHMWEHPARGYDDHDAAEMAYRKLWEWFGNMPDRSAAGKANDGLTDLQRAQSTLMLDQEPPKERDRDEEAMEALLAEDARMLTGLSVEDEADLEGVAA